MNKTGIEWTQYTWNPVTGCFHGCEYCYAQRIAHRFGEQGGETGTTHVLKSKTKGYPYPFGFDPTMHEYRMTEPMRLKAPSTIFVCSMADLFGEWVDTAWIEAVLEACDNAPQHRYLFLTKNPKRYGQLSGYGDLRKNDRFWYGVTAEDQKAAEERMGMLPSSLAGYRYFLSAEPLSGQIKLSHVIPSPNWVIIGAETGNRAGKVVPKKQWIEDLVKEADEIGTPVFMKDSLIPIVGEMNMRRELPWETTE